MMQSYRSKIRNDLTEVRCQKLQSVHAIASLQGRLDGGGGWVCCH